MYIIKYMERDPIAKAAFQYWLSKLRINPQEEWCRF